jgi:phosphoglycolate phosphatase
MLRSNNSRFKRTKELVLFDLDGVLLDSKENMRLSWESVRREAGVTVPFDRYFAEIGRPFGSILDRLDLSDHSVAIEAAFRTASMENIGVLKFYPGVIETLSRLETAGIKFGIVTSKDILRTSAILAMLSSTFSCIQTPDNELRGKPAPDHLLLAMSKVGVDPINTLYVGDMAADHEAAMRAGIDYAHASWGYGRPPEDESWVLSKMPDLLDFITLASGP